MTDMKPTFRVFPEPVPQTTERGARRWAVRTVLAGKQYEAHFQTEEAARAHIKELQRVD